MSRTLIRTRIRARIRTRIYNRMDLKGGEATTAQKARAKQTREEEEKVLKAMRGEAREALIQKREAILEANGPVLIRIDPY